jgi:hypothetical protein
MDQLIREINDILAKPKRFTEKCAVIKTIHNLLTMYFDSPDIPSITYNKIIKIVATVWLKIANIFFNCTTSPDKTIIAESMYIMKGSCPSYSCDLLMHIICQARNKEALSTSSRIFLHMKCSDMVFLKMLFNRIVISEDSNTHQCRNNNSICYAIVPRDVKNKLPDPRLLEIFNAQREYLLVRKSPRIEIYLKSFGIDIHQDKVWTLNDMFYNACNKINEKPSYLKNCIWTNSYADLLIDHLIKKDTAHEKNIIDACKNITNMSFFNVLKRIDLPKIEIIMGGVNHIEINVFDDIYEILHIKSPELIDYAMKFIDIRKIDLVSNKEVNAFYNDKVEKFTNFLGIGKNPILAERIMCREDWRNKIYTPEYIKYCIVNNLDIYQPSKLFEYLNIKTIVVSPEEFLNIQMANYSTSIIQVKFTDPPGGKYICCYARDTPIILLADQYDDIEINELEYNVCRTDVGTYIVKYGLREIILKFIKNDIRDRTYSIIETVN